MNTAPRPRPGDGGPPAASRAAHAGIAVDRQRNILISAVLTALLILSLVVGAGIGDWMPGTGDSGDGPDPGAPTGLEQTIDEDGLPQSGEPLPEDATGAETEGDDAQSADIPQSAATAHAGEESELQVERAPAAAGDGKTTITIKATTSKNSMTPNHWSTEDPRNRAGLRFGIFENRADTVPKYTCTFAAGARSCTVEVADEDRTYFIRHIDSDPANAVAGDPAYGPRLNGTADFRAIDRSPDYEQQFTVKKSQDNVYPDSEYLKNGISYVSISNHAVYGPIALPADYAPAVRLANPLMGTLTADAEMVESAQAEADPGKAMRDAMDQELCDKGVTVALVADVSISVNKKVRQYRDALLAFVGALAESPGDNSVALYSFASTSPGDRSHANITTPINVSGPGGVPASVKNWIEGLDTSSTLQAQTNWDVAMQRVDEAMDKAGGPKYDLVLFVTDGNPNNLGENPTRAGTNLTAFDESIIAGNRIKEHGTRVVVQRIKELEEDQILRQHFRGMSGPVAYDPVEALRGGMSLNDFDFSPEDSYEGLANALKKYVQDTLQCHFDVTVDKEAEDYLGDPERTNADWDFTVEIPQDSGAKVDHDPDRPEWNPNLIWDPHYTPAPAPMTTNGDGYARAEVMLKDKSRFPITLWEAFDPADDPLEKWETEVDCTVGRGSATPTHLPAHVDRDFNHPGGPRVTVTFPKPEDYPANHPDYDASGQRLFGHGDHVTCAFRNERSGPALRVDKLWQVARDGEEWPAPAAHADRPDGFDAALQLDALPGQSGATPWGKAVFDFGDRATIREDVTLPSTCRLEEAALHRGRPSAVGDPSSLVGTASDLDSPGFAPQPVNPEAPNRFTVVNRVRCTIPLTLEKELSFPDNLDPDFAGQFAVDDWMLTALAGNPLSPVVDGRSGVTAERSLDDRTYTLTERYEPPPGRVPVREGASFQPTWRCAADTGPTRPGGAPTTKDIPVTRHEDGSQTVTIPDEDRWLPVTCTAVNSVPTLTLEKKLQVPDVLETYRFVVDDWKLKAAPVGDQEHPIVDDVTGSGGAIGALPDAAGEYVLSEEFVGDGTGMADPDSLKATWSCAFDDGMPGTPTLSDRNGQKVLTVGEDDQGRSIRCQVVNAAQTFTLLKHVYFEGDTAYKPEHWTLDMDYSLQAGGVPGWASIPGTPRIEAGVNTWATDGWRDKLEVKEHWKGGPGVSEPSGKAYKQSLERWDWSRPGCRLSGAALGRAVEQVGHPCWERRVDDLSDWTPVRVPYRDWESPVIVRFLNRNAEPPPPFEPDPPKLPLTGGFDRDLPLIVGAALAFTGCGLALALRKRRRL